MTMIYDKILDAMGLPFTLVYAALLLGFAYFVFISVPRTLSTKSWPTTTGRVTASKLREERRLSNGSSIPVYSADITYAYEVDHKEYSSTKIKWVDHNSTSKRHHQEVLKKYPIDQSVTVFFNPKKPSISLLEPGFGTGNLIALIFFILSLGPMSFLLSSKL